MWSSDKTGKRAIKAIANDQIQKFKKEVQFVCQKLPT